MNNLFSLIQAYQHYTQQKICCLRQGLDLKNVPSIAQDYCSALFMFLKHIQDSNQIEQHLFESIELETANHLCLAEPFDWFSSIKNTYHQCLLRLPSKSIQQILLKINQKNAQVFDLYLKSRLNVLEVLQPLDADDLFALLNTRDYFSRLLTLSIERNFLKSYFQLLQHKYTSKQHHKEQLQHLLTQKKLNIEPITTHSDPEVMVEFIQLLIATSANIFNTDKQLLILTHYLNHEKNTQQKATVMILLLNYFTFEENILRKWITKELKHSVRHTLLQWPYDQYQTLFDNILNKKTSLGTFCWMHTCRYSLFSGPPKTIQVLETHIQQFSSQEYKP